MAAQAGDHGLEGLQEGSPEAWKAFLRRYLPVLYGAVLRTMNGMREEAEDVVQDVLMRLCRDDYALLRRYDPARASLPTWLTLVARSAALDAMRRRRGVQVPLESIPEPAAPAGGTADRLHLPENLLSPRQILVLRLLYDHDLDPSEAAAVLGIEVQTVRSTHHKALQKLRRIHSVADQGTKL